MRSAGQIPLSRALDNARKEAAVRYSGTAANSATETISPLIFHPAIPIQPPPLRGTSFHRKEGVSTQAPSLGRGCRAKRGGVAKPPPLCLPHWGRRAASAVDRVLSYIVDLRRISPLIFHTARTLSGSLRSPPSPRGEGFVSEIPLSPSNLRPFGAPPSIGRREYPRKPLPLEGAAERSEAGLASFWGGEAAAKSWKAGIRD